MMPRTDLYVFRTRREADVLFPRRARQRHQLVMSVPEIERGWESLCGVYLGDVYLYWPLLHAGRSMVLSRTHRAGPSRVYEVQDEKPPLPGEAARL